MHGTFRAVRDLTDLEMAELKDSCIILAFHCSSILSSAEPSICCQHHCKRRQCAHGTGGQKKN